MQFKAVAAVATAALLLAGCGGSGAEPGGESPSPTGASNQPGGRSTSGVVGSGEARVEIKGGIGYFVGTLANRGSDEVNLRSVVAQGFSVVSVGSLEGTDVSFVPGGLPLPGGEKRSFTTRGEVIQLQYPDGSYPAGTKLRFEFNFDDFSKAVVEATLTEPLRHNG